MHWKYSIWCSNFSLTYNTIMAGKLFNSACKNYGKNIKHLLYCFINKTSLQNLETDMDETDSILPLCYDSVK